MELLSPQTPRRALLADRIFDGERVIADMAVILDGDTIATLVPAQQIPPDTPTLRAPGCTLLPGLIDMHIHFMRWQGPLFLAAGVTTVRDVGNRLDWILDRRAEWKAHPWPRIYTFGPVLDGPVPVHGDCCRTCVDADSARAAVAQTAAAGVDGIKLYVGLREEWLAGMIEEARTAGLHTAMHCGRVRALAAGAAGVDEFFHLDGLLPDIWPDNPGGWLETWGHPGLAATFDRQQEIADAVRQSGIIATPTLAWWESNVTTRMPGFPTEREVAEIPPEIEAWQRSLPYCRPDSDAAETWRRALAAAQRFVGLLRERGVPLLAGTDTPCGLLAPGRSLWRELSLMVECGCSPMEVLRAATSQAAAYLGDPRLGRIASGHRADLVAVRGDLAREIPASPEVVMVVRGGEVFSPDDLLTQARREASGAGGDPWQTEFARPVTPG